MGSAGPLRRPEQYAANRRRRGRNRKIPAAGLRHIHQEILSIVRGHHRGDVAEGHGIGLGRGLPEDLRLLGKHHLSC